MPVVSRRPGRKAVPQSPMQSAFLRDTTVTGCPPEMRVAEIGACSTVNRPISLRRIDVEERSDVRSALPAFMVADAPEGGLRLLDGERRRRLPAERTGQARWEERACVPCPRSASDGQLRPGCATSSTAGPTWRPSCPTSNSSFAPQLAAALPNGHDQRPRTWHSPVSGVTITNQAGRYSADSLWQISVSSAPLGFVVLLGREDTGRPLNPPADG